MQVKERRKSLAQELKLVYKDKPSLDCSNFGKHIVK